MIRINIRSIAHGEQEYETAGNYWREFPGGTETLEIRVSAMRDRRYEFLVAVHELIEALLCDERKISYARITRFDLEYERNRRKGDRSEPGESPAAPYRQEHRFAELIERMLAHELGVEWAHYDRTVTGLK